MEINFQNPDTNQTVILNLTENSKVYNAVDMLIQQLKLNSPPLLYAYMNDNSLKDLRRRTTVNGHRVDLPDDMPIADVMKNMRDAALPIYFQTLEISETKLFELRTLRFSQVGYKTDVLHGSKVLLAGAGLLGSEIAVNLATLGIGNISIIDNGHVDWTNIYRQPVYSKKDVYKKKVDIIKLRLEEIGGIKVTPMYLELPSWTATMAREEAKKSIILLDEAITDADIVVGILDKFSPRALIQFICLIRKRPFVVAALEASTGYVSIFDKNAENGCYCCGLPNPHQVKWPDGGACTLSPIESQKIIASLATKFIIDALEGKDNRRNKIVYNAMTMITETFMQLGSQHCSLCGESGAAKINNLDLADSTVDYLFNSFE